MHTKLEKNFTCNVCGLKLRFLYKYEKHVQMHVAGQLGCGNCKREFASLWSLADHRKTKTCTPSNSATNDVEPFICQHCKRIFTNKKQLNEHKDNLSHWSCDTCEQLFMRDDILNQHSMSEHGDQHIGDPDDVKSLFIQFQNMDTTCEDNEEDGHMDTAIKQ